jgi:PilZ domain
MLTPFEERRRSPRRLFGRVATLLATDGTKERFCLVKDISADGVRLTANGYEIPEKFVLHFAGGKPQQDGTYQVVWRNGQEAGAKYLNGHSAAA